MPRLQSLVSQSSLSGDAGPLLLSSVRPAGDISRACVQTIASAEPQCVPPCADARRATSSCTNPATARPSSQQHQQVPKVRGMRLQSAPP